jgi:hypothetical protein
VYTWFLAAYKVSVAVGMTGCVMLVCEIFGLGVLLDLLLPKGTCILLIWYGLYFGVLGRDCAEVAADQMVRGGCSCGWRLAAGCRCRRCQGAGAWPAARRRRAAGADGRRCLAVRAGAGDGLGADVASQQLRQLRQQPWGGGAPATSFSCSVDKEPGRCSTAAQRPRRARTQAARAQAADGGARAPPAPQPDAERGALRAAQLLPRPVRARLDHGKKDTCPVCLEKVDLRLVHDKPWDSTNLRWWVLPGPPRGAWGLCPAASLPLGPGAAPRRPGLLQRCRRAPSADGGAAARPPARARRIRMLDAFRYLVVWNPLIFMAFSLLSHFFPHRHGHHHDAGTPPPLPMGAAVPRSL